MKHLKKLRTYFVLPKDEVERVLDNQGFLHVFERSSNFSSAGFESHKKLLMLLTSPVWIFFFANFTEPFSVRRSQQLVTVHHLKIGIFGRIFCLQIGSTLKKI
jgi:hypothetical protein